MAELALGALGVVPLVGVAIKGYRALASKLKTFRQHHAAVKRVYRKLKTQRRLFLFESELLIRHCLNDDGLAEAMVADPGHRHWTDGHLDLTCRTALDSHYDECSELVREIVEAIEQFDNELASFATVLSNQRPGEKFKDAWKRLGDRVKITLNQSTYESNLAELRGDNTDLKSLRKQICGSKTPSNRLSSKRPITDPMDDWGEIRLASTALHKSLADAWSCSQAHHARHFIKLFLETQKSQDETIRMDIAILAHGYTLSNVICRHSLTQIQVRSTLFSTFRPMPSPSVSGDEQGHLPRKKRKMVRFGESVAISCDPRPSIQPNRQVQDPSTDLRGASDICTTLASQCKGIAADMPTSCVGFLVEQAEKSYRHIFYPPDSQGFLPIADEYPLFQMDTVLCEPSHDILPRLDKLRLARSLTVAVLKFHETPWLGEAWRLQDLSFFYNERDVVRSLQTLHLHVGFDRSSRSLHPSNDSRVMMTPNSSTNSNLSQATDDERLMYGLDNLALYCLGVALLQIERAEQLDPENVLTVRKMAKTSSNFGWRYRQLVDKCIRCDFGYGTDLGQERLLKAVHQSVVGELDTLIAAFAAIDIGNET